MKTNVGNIDKMLRIAMAIVFAVLYFTGAVPGPWNIVLLVLGGVFLLTGLVGTCPLYSLFGISTCPVKKG